jgi:hypothetical protein
MLRSVSKGCFRAMYLNFGLLGTDLICDCWGGLLLHIVVMSRACQMKLLSFSSNTLVKVRSYLHLPLLMH